MKLVGAKKSPNADLSDLFAVRDKLKDMGHWVEIYTSSGEQMRKIAIDAAKAKHKWIMKKRLQFKSGGVVSANEFFFGGGGI